MAEPNETRPTPLGIYDRPSAEKITSIEIIAITLSAIWLIGAGVFFLFVPSEPTPEGSGLGTMRFMMTMLAIFMPVGMIWVAATAARSSKIMREESQRLQAAIDAIRHAYISQNQSGKAVSEPSVAQKLEEIAAAQRKTETALATFTSSREAKPMRAQPPETRAQAPEEQTALPLGTTAEDMAPAITREEFIRAINFPETVDDAAGFNALRKALKDHATSGLVQAAQDVLTLLSQDGIYMDDLNPDMARPEVWRMFAAGTRGRQIAALGGVRDRSSLALAAGRMREDPIFRDAVHHFLRRFDKSFTQFEADASDAEISELAGTRTARAFMLLGRVAGVFD